MNSPFPKLRLPSRGAKTLLAAAMLLPPLALSFPTQAQSAPRLAFVSRSVPVPSADTAYVKHLRERGWDVTAIDDDKIQSAGRSAVGGYDLVVVSSTVYPSRIEGRLRGAPEPIIVAEHQLFPAFGMSGTGSADRGLTDASKKIVIRNSSHPMAAGFGGDAYVGTKAKPLNYAKVGRDAQVIASAPGASDKAVVFAYGAGDTLADGKAAEGVRIGFYMSQSYPRLANRDGWALFDAAAAWASPNAPQGGSPDAGTPKPLTVSHGTLLGANVSKERYPSRYDAVQGFERQIGRGLDIVNRFHEFSAALDSGFYWDRMHVEAGRTVMVSWRATDNAGSTKGEPDPNRANKIVAGRFDAEIKAMARGLRDLDATVLLRFNWEMDQDYGDPQYIGTPDEFIAAWRYVHRLFEQVGAKNVEWVWAPRARSFAKGIGQRYFPGHEYVDWIGGSAVPIHSFTDARTIYSDWNEWAASIGKPQLLWIGLRENPNDSGWKARFVNDLYHLATTEWTGLRALVYYNSNSPLGYDYTIDTSSGSLSAFRKLGCDPHFSVANGC